MEMLYHNRPAVFLSFSVSSCKVALKLNSTLSDFGPIRRVGPSNLWIRVALGFLLTNSSDLLLNASKERESMNRLILQIVILSKKL